MSSMLLSCFLCALGLADPQQVISENGKSDYVIVVPDAPTAVVKTASKELQGHLTQVIGQELPIVPLSQRPQKAPAFVIGVDQDGFDFSKSEQDSIGIRFVEDDIQLNGHPRRGPLYAVYTFLEDYVGIRWWTPTDSYIPSKPTLSVLKKDHIYTPKIRCRETFYKDSFQAPFSVRQKSNGHFAEIPEEYGGNMSIIGFVHTFYQFMPPEKYFKDHPDWYAMDNGKRVWEMHQLCLTNEEMTKEFTRIVLEKIRQEPHAGIISVSHNDCHIRCQCPKCLAVEEEEGSQAGPLIRFVNKIAAEVEKEAPDFLVETLAYHYTRHAPKKTKPAHNVLIRLCSIEGNFAQSLENGPANASFSQDLRDWSAIAKHLYIWNYITNFHNYVLPQPNWKHLADDIRFFVDHHAIGMFEQGDAGCNVGDFVRPRQWIIAHLLWDPSRDQRQLMEEFFNGYYGAAGPHLINYIDWLCELVEKSNIYLRCYGYSAEPWMPKEQLPEAIRRYKLAEDAVKDDPVLSERVRRERIPLDLASLITMLQYLPQATLHGEDCSRFFPEPPLELAKNFDALCQKYNIGCIQECVAYDKYGQKLIQDVTAALEKVPVPDGVKGASNWLYYPAGKMTLYHEGEWASLIQDEKAFNGKAVKMPCNHTEWATQIKVQEALPEGSTWKIQLRVRVEGATGNEPVMQFGFYDPKARKNVYSKEITAGEIGRDGYVTYEEPSLTPKQKDVLWLAPCVNKDLQQGASAAVVFIDSVALIQEEQAQHND